MIWNFSGDESRTLIPDHVFIPAHRRVEPRLLWMSNLHVSRTLTHTHSFCGQLDFLTIAKIPIHPKKETVTRLQPRLLPAFDYQDGDVIKQPMLHTSKYKTSNFGAKKTYFQPVCSQNGAMTDITAQHDWNHLTYSAVYHQRATCVFKAANRIRWQMFQSPSQPNHFGILSLRLASSGWGNPTAPSAGSFTHFVNMTQTSSQVRVVFVGGVWGAAVDSPASLPPVTNKIWL